MTRGKFSNFEVQQQDFGAHAFAFGARSWSSDRLFSTAALKSFWHVVHGIYMCVCFPTSAFRSHTHRSALPVGSTLRLFTLSWISSEAVAPTGRQYGSVPTGAFSRLGPPPLRLGLISTFRRFTPLRAHLFLLPRSLTSLTSTLRHHSTVRWVVRFLCIFTRIP